MSKEPMNQDAFVERIAKVMRTAESPDATFEARAMSAVHAAARAERSADARRSWWLRPRSVRFTPLAALAMAAGFAAIVLVGSSSISGTLLPSVPGEGARQTVGSTERDTVHVVRFLFVDSAATRVALVGGFNQWKKDALLLRQVGTTGVWSVDVPLHGGRYEYAFVVYDQDGERWVADRFAPSTRDEFGTETSLISVATRGS